MTTHLLTPEEWGGLSADSRHAIERMQARLAKMESVLEYLLDRMLLLQSYKDRYLTLRIGVYAALEIDMPEISDEQLIGAVKHLYESSREAA